MLSNQPMRSTAAVGYGSGICLHSNNVKGQSWCAGWVVTTCRSSLACHYVNATCLAEWQLHGGPPVTDATVDAAEELADIGVEAAITHCCCCYSCCYHWQQLPPCTRRLPATKTLELTRKQGGCLAVCRMRSLTTDHHLLLLLLLLLLLWQ
jgi:hypothetical protein